MVSRVTVIIFNECYCMYTCLETFMGVEKKCPRVLNYTNVPAVADYNQKGTWYSYGIAGCDPMPEWNLLSRDLSTGYLSQGFKV